MDEKKHQNQTQKSRGDDPERDEARPAIEIPEEAAEVIRTLESERDEAADARKRALADFQNYQRRAMENERRARVEGAKQVVRNILPVLDHFDLAIDQSAKELTVEQLLGGVKIVRDELQKALQTSGIERIEPKPGEAFNPNLHEAMMHQPSDDIEPGHIVSVLQRGYRMGEQVLRPAKVGLAGPTDSADDGAESAANEE